MKRRLPHGLHILMRVPLGLLFVWTGILKLLDIRGFAVAVSDFGLVHDSLVLPVAWTVALAEIVAGAALVFNMRASLAAILSLLLIFIGVLSYGILLGLDIDCGCLGPAFSVGLRAQLMIDLALVAWCMLVYSTRHTSAAAT